MKVVCVVGESDSGKTTLIEMLVEGLSDRGRVGTVKHTSHHFDIDTEGTDTARHRLAGARTTYGISEEGWFATGAETTLHEVLNRLAPQHDYALVEGYADTTLPKIVLGDRVANSPVVVEASDADAVSLDETLRVIEDLEPAVSRQSRRPNPKTYMYSNKSSPMANTSGQIGDEMTEEEAMSLLKTEGHGVLSMGNNDRGYGIPVSFGYDEANERFLFEFLNIGDTKKEQFVTATEEVTLTVYNFEDPETWESAIVTGTIHAIDAADLSEQSVSSFASQADDGAEELRWAEAQDLERQWYEVRPISITGRHR
jgi:molybdopterin-guanine dinucleotide biosynthesis protein MobB